MSGKTRTCRLDDCSESHYAKGFCQQHYGQWKYVGRPDPETWKPKLKHDGCRIDDCSESHYAKGFCFNHYQRWRHAGRPNQETWQRRSKCDGCRVDNCTDDHRAKGFCRNHYEQWDRAGGRTRRLGSQSGSMVIVVLLVATGNIAPKASVVITTSNGIVPVGRIQRCGSRQDLVEHYKLSASSFAGALLLLHDCACSS